MNRDLIAAGIDKINEWGGRVHVHALRHSTGTHLSAANVAPRTAQAVMRHSDISLTMNTYTDERLLDAAGALERLPNLPLAKRAGDQRKAAAGHSGPPECSNGCPRCCPKLGQRVSKLAGIGIFAGQSGGGRKR